MYIQQIYSLEVKTYIQYSFLCVDLKNSAFRVSCISDSLDVDAEMVIHIPVSPKLWNYILYIY